MGQSLQTIEELITQDEKLSGVRVKLLGIGVEGQALAGQLSYSLNKKGIRVGIAAVEEQSELHTNIVVYTGKSDTHMLTVDRNSLRMGEVCIAVGSHFTKDAEKAINELATDAQVHCPYYCSVTNPGKCALGTEEQDKTAHPDLYAARVSPLFFQNALLKTLPAERFNVLDMSRK